MKEFTQDYLENIRRIIAERDDEAARRELADLHLSLIHISEPTRP